MIATLNHPGPAPARRWAQAPCRATPLDVLLPVAATLAQSAALALAGFDGGWLDLAAAPLANLDFVLPGEDATGAHAAWYAGPWRMGAGQITRLGMHVGRKEGGAWIHGHGAFDAPGWQGPRFGHILPLESRLARPVRATGWGISGARLAVAPDAETGFALFRPQPQSQPLGDGANALLLTLRPSQDLTTALEQAAAEAGITQGRIVGLGSLVRPKFEGQPRIDSLATEILLTEGRLQQGKARLAAEIVTIDMTRHQGWLERGANGICITAEILIIAD